MHLKGSIDDALEMQACLQVFEQGWLQLPKDDFLRQGVTLLRGGPKVAEFQALCRAELMRVYSHGDGATARFPYSLQSGWIHNVRLAKSMVIWALSGRQSPPQRLSTKGKRVSVPAVVAVPVPVIPPVPSWEDCLLNMAWQMLQHVLSFSSLTLPSGWTQQTQLSMLSSQARKAEGISVPLPGHQEKHQQAPLFYPAQVEMAERLFRTLFGDQDGECWSNYEEMDFRILLPPSVSLQAQTIQRVKEVFGFDNDFVMEGKVLNRCMFRAGAANADYERLKEAVMERDEVSGRKRRLMVIIVDECHLGIGRGGQMDVLINGAAHGRTGVECNRERILMEDNVYVVYVSATGWNCLPGVLPEKTVMWGEDPVGYTGWKSYCLDGGRNRDRLCNGAGYQHLLDYFRSLFQKRSSAAGGDMDPKLFTLLPSLVLMVDYGLALSSTGGGEGGASYSMCSEETRRIISDHLSHDGSDGTTVVRVQQNGAQGAMVRWLRYFLGDTVRIETSLKGLSSRGETREEEGKGRKSSFCVLVEKGRYGDSFPGRLMHYDLRARYHRPSCTFSSLLQDVGRCFGYGQSSDGGEDGKGPWIVLNPQGHRLFMGKEVKLVVDRYLTKNGEAHRKSMWKGSERGKEQRWALLLAQPQVGKTGAYLKLLEMVKHRCGAVDAVTSEP